LLDLVAVLAVENLVMVMLQVWLQQGFLALAHQDRATLVVKRLEQRGLVAVAAVELVQSVATGQVIVPMQLDVLVVMVV
jgi:hypothetical protein